MNKGKTIRSVIALVVLVSVVIYSAYTTFFKTDKSEKPKTTVNKGIVADIDKKENETATDKKMEDAITQQMKDYSKQFNAYLPKDAGNGITMVSIDVVGDRIFKFLYSFNAKAEKTYKEKGKGESIKDDLIQKIKTEAMFSPFRKNKVTIIFSYVNSKDEVIEEITVTPDDYK